MIPPIANLDSFLIDSSKHLLPLYIQSETGIFHSIGTLMSLELHSYAIPLASFWDRATE